MTTKRLSGLAGLVAVVVLGQEHDLFAKDMKPTGPLFSTAERVCPDHWQSRVLHKTATQLRSSDHWNEGHPAGSASWNEARYQEACRVVTASMMLEGQTGR
ncbi:hypothetical protein [Muricoccus nepalensis]|uniref:hypothetical protein n=1 Tax=Muricoccus nepalensis TaxID=1854500 RepID=UPI0011268D97|nr:hypothetical protein [Roseomonas nepalensis]